MSGDFTEFPVEILDRILSSLDLKDVLTLSRCNKKLRFKVCNCDIWRKISQALWNQYQDNDILEDFTQSHSIFEVQEDKIIGDYYWYSYCMNRLHVDNKVFNTLKRILSLQLKPNYWKELWNYLNDKNFVMLIPVLSDIMDSDLLKSSNNYRSDRLNLFGYSCLSLPLKKISSELLRASRLKHLFAECVGLGYTEDELFTTENTCELLLLKYSAIDIAYHRLLPYRNMFLTLVGRILAAREKHLNENFDALNPFRKIRILVQVVMSIIRKNATHFLTKFYAEDFMLLRVYAGETKGVLLIHLVIIQRVLRKYGIESELLQRHLKITFSSSSNELQPDVIFLSLDENTLQHKLFTESQLRQVVDEHRFKQYMKPLSKQNVFKWLYHESAIYSKSKIMDSENYLMKIDWKATFPHSQLPLSTLVLRSFNDIYCAFSSPMDISEPHSELWYQLYYDGTSGMIRAMSPLEVKLMEYFNVLKQDKKSEDYLDFPILHKVWLSSQYMINDTNKQIYGSIIGKIVYIPGRFACVCVIGIDPEDSTKMIVMDIMGGVHKYNRPNQLPDRWNVASPDVKKLLANFLRVMDASGKLGLLFSHFDMQEHRYIKLIDTESNVTT